VSARNISFLVKKYIEQDRLEEAAKLLDTAIALVENHPVREGNDYDQLLVELLVDRANILNSLGQHDKALPLYRRGAASATVRWGRGHPMTAVPTLGIASVMNKKGDFAAARELYERCYVTLEGAYGTGHPHTADAAIDLAVCLSNLDEYHRAEKVLRRNLVATINTLGENNAQACELMLTQAEVLAMLGRQVESTRLYRRAAIIAEEVYGRDHTRMAAALSGLAHTMRRMGDSAGADELYRRSIQIVMERHGTPHPDLIHYRSRLGMCWFEYRKNTDKGLESIEEAIAEAIEIYGPDSYQVALEERQAGLLLTYENRNDEAYAVFAKSLRTLERYFGPDHPFLSKCLKGLADVCTRLGLYDEALDNINRAIALHKSTAGRDQLELTFLLSQKSLVELRLQHWDDALASALSALEMAQTVLEEVYQVASTREALMYATRARGCVVGLMSAAMAHPRLPDSTMAMVYSWVAGTHGQVLDRLAARHRFLEAVADSGDVEQLWRDQIATTQRVSDLVVSGPEDDEAAYRDKLARARRDQENAEREYSAAVERLRALAPRRERSVVVSADEVKAALDDDATLIHFVSYPRRPHPKSPRDIARDPHYGAFMLRKTRAHHPTVEFVDLGSVVSIDSLIFAYRRSIDDIETGHRPSAREEGEYRQTARQLYNRIWAPLLRLIGARPDEKTINTLETIGPRVADSPATVFIVPGSWFHLVDFNTLLSPSGGLVIERYKLHYLSSANDLLRPPRDRPGGDGMLAVGNPLYAPAVLEREPAPGREPAAEFVRRGASPAFCIDTEVVSASLPAAEREAQSVARLFSETTGERAVIKIGVDAKEDVVKSELVGKRMAHFATHGYFCEEETRELIPYPHRLVNPLLHSGLVLAAESGGGEDGLLTAQELVCLDLRDLDWVVLGACGSGLGRLIIGEGLFGLRRAFEIAGARTVVTALWQIGDTETRHIMEGIYRRRLAGETTIDAVREAQLGLLGDCRRRFNRIHPALWGGIIAEGDWR
jgi:CHAT domain-containing protein